MPERHAPAALRLEALSPLSFSLQLEFRVLKGIGFGVLILGFLKQEVEKAKAKRFRQRRQAEGQGHLG